MRSAEAVFWTAGLAIFYVYAGYALLLALWARLAGRPVRARSWEPTVSVVVATRDDGATVLAKIADCAAFDYPAEKLEIVVSLDGGSDEVRRAATRALAGRRGVVLASGRPEGKAAAINRAVAASKGEVIVFCDARQHVAPEALRSLVADLADPAVGAVSGELDLLDGHGRPSGDGVGIYWRYEKAVRQLESRVHSTVGATGALYALRRELFRPLPERLVLDDVLVPMRAVLAGRRTVFEPGAHVYDQARPPREEYRRKVRTLIGNFQLLRLAPELLKPEANPILLQFLSHKVGRLLAPYLLVVLYAANLALLDRPFYVATFVVQSALYLLAAAGALASGVAGGSRERRGLRLVSAPYDFVLMNWAAVAAFARFARGVDLERIWPRAVGGAPSAGR